MSDLVGTQIVGLLTHSLISLRSRAGEWTRCNRRALIRQSKSLHIYIAKSSIVQIVFSFRSLGILKNQKIITGLDSFSNQWLCFDNTRLCIDCRVESCKITVFLFGSILLNLKGH